MMPDILRAAALRDLNTFGINESAEQLVPVETEQQLREALALADAQGWPVTVLGGGSNMILAGPLAGLVIAMRSRGRRVLSREPGSAVIEGEAGENWHQLVNWSLDHGFHGLENLSLIPGTLGAAPMQNIGAYGVELCDVFDSLDALDRTTGEVCRFDRDACRFAYRDSLFKQQAGRFVILRVRLRLSTQPVPRLDYAPLAAAWSVTGLSRPDSRVISQLVCQIRRSKLPDPAQLGNAGSFFKNPLLPADQAAALLATWPEAPHYPQPDGSVKLAAGWLIERAGWKGHCRDRVGVHREQALVLVNLGGARGADVLALAEDIQRDVQAKFGVQLEMEPQRVGG
ncbi:UDP-N-acetylmuramate dehydrogenase [Pseudomonas sp. G11-1]|uniref:UDP-N-acetylenolpyruvoylglucosamine reductase n=1 Tax=Halopseudomonas bauzanensis TaxID=653930 RepID=A0A1H9REH7_9GAMM|nr:UDP-N-acetylmuramate dehydrogenase [Halopseudomonas bauzanensis]MCO5787523.1 UDP-N-acetylmuramate dehydrogenase [Pseudomonas sp. G11-1]MCO5790746.1 UDP-N-acetylmuramate dehydrogenase [Pseudomonas sp. G11-2]SER71092.1 UDP-N-acetylmuramate dehydrogenase [Halopseudomonas bauzanensis]SFL58890.1 UDP-N-acetylmuramate dehydrogenase [Halopseudomonas bauzanensis]